MVYNKKIIAIIELAVLFSLPLFGMFGNANDEPVADFSYEVDVESRTVYVDASDSYVPFSGGEIIEYAWDWTNDGTYDDYGVEASHTYSDIDCYSIKLKVIDDSEGEDSTFKFVDIGHENFFHLKPIDDAYISSEDSEGLEDYLSCSTGEYIYLKFSLSNLTSGSVVKYAYLHLYCQLAIVVDEISVKAYSCTNSEWFEETITLNNAPSFSQTVLDSVEIEYVQSLSPDSDERVDFDVADYVQSHINEQITIVLSCENAQGATFRSKEFQENMPELSIRTISPSSPNQPPTCSLSASPTSGYAPLDVTYSFSASDTDGSIDSWELDIDNDGSADYTGSGSLPATKSHTYQNVGEYTAKLTVTDDDGATESDTTTITVNEQPNQAPTANFDYAPAKPTANTTVNFTDTSTDTDGAIANCTWNYGDGTTGYGQTANHTYTAPGPYNVTLTVTDDDGDTDTYVSAITVEEEKEGGTPGFGLALLVMAIAAMILVKRRKKEALK